MPGPKADEGLDPLIDRVGAPIGDRCSSVEMIGFGEEGDLGIRVPGGEVVGAEQDPGEREVPKLGSGIEDSA